jgi:hypothetical protein
LKPSSNTTRLKAAKAHFINSQSKFKKSGKGKGKCRFKPYFKSIKWSKQRILYLLQTIRAHQRQMP